MTWSGRDLHSLAVTGVRRDDWPRVTGLSWDQIDARLSEFYRQKSEKGDDPSPEEIAAACEAIRLGWSPAEHERRVVGPRRTSVECVPVTGLTRPRACGPG